MVSRRHGSNRVGFVGSPPFWGFGGPIRLVYRGVIVVLLNNNSIRSVGALGLLMVAAGSAFAGALAPQKASADKRLSTSQGQQALAARTARFLENKGQWDSRAKFVAKGAALDLWFTDNGIRYDHHPVLKQGAKRQVVDMYFPGGKVTAPTGRYDTGARADYFLPSGTAKGARAFRELYTKNVVSGVDMRSYFDGSRPRFDFIVAPGTDPSNLKLGFRGNTGLSLAKGQLKIGTAMGGFKNGKPFAYQTIAGKTKAVSAQWTVKNGQASFALGAYDHSKALVIDPVVYGTYFGGDHGADEVHAIVSDTIAGGTEGSVLLTGGTRTSSFPTSTGLFNYNNPIGIDAFVARLQGDAYNRDYSVFVGGSGYDIGKFIKLDNLGNVWIAGVSTSQFFFTTAATNATNDIFVMRFIRNGTAALQYDPNGFRFFGAPGTDDILAGFDVLKSTPVTMANYTELIITGSGTVAPAGFPGTHPKNTGDNSPIYSGYIAMLDYSNGNFFFDNAMCKYMVGDNGAVNDTRGCVYDANGNILVAGTVYGTANQNTDYRTGGDPSIFFTTSDVFSQTSTGYDGGQLLRNSDIFVRKYDRNADIVYSGLIGGASGEECGGIAVGQPDPLRSGTNDTGTAYTGSAIAVDPDGNAYVTGVSRSFNFPRTNGVYGETFNSQPNVTVTKINPTGTALLYSTNLKVTAAMTNGIGIATVAPAGIGVDSRGNAFITGNLRPLTITFPDTAGDPNELTGSTLSSINIPTGLADVPDPTYDSPTGTEYPTTEGFIMVLNPTATGLQFASYLGGVLDDFVYAPFVDANGDVWAMGWTDGRRDYARQGTTSVKTYGTNATLQGGLITNLALKTTIDTDDSGPLSGNFDTMQYNFGYGFFGTQGLAKTPTRNAGSFARDGFIVKFRVNQPSVGSVTLNPSTLPGGLGVSTTGTVTLTQAAPSGGAQVTVNLPNGTNYASFTSETSDVDSVTIDIAAGATTANFTLFTKAVLINQLVKVRATYTGTFKETTLQVVPWLVSEQLPAATMVGGDPNNMRGVVTLAAPAPAGGVAIALTASDSAVQFVGLPFVIPAGQTSAQFTLTSDGVDAPTAVSVQATLLGLTKSASLTLLPATLQSITLTPSTVAGGSPSVATITLNGKAGPLPYTATITSDSSKAIPAGTTITVDPQTVSSTVGVDINTLPVTTSTTANITATHTASTGHPFAQKSATLTIQPVLVNGLTLVPTTVESGGTSEATITLSTAAPTGGARIYVSSSDTSIARVFAEDDDALPTDGIGSYVTIPEGDTQATFHVTGRYVQTNSTVAISASGGIGTPKTTNLTVKAISYTLVLDPTSTIGSASGSNVVTGTVTLTTGAATENVTFAVSTDNSTVFPSGTFDTSVTIVAGDSTGSFSLRPKGVTSSQSVTITTAFGTNTKTKLLVVRPVGVASLTSLQRTVRGGGQINLVANFEAETSVAADLVLTTNLPSAFPTGTFTLETSGAFAGQYTKHYSIQAGVTSQALFPALTVKRLSRSQDVTFTATYNGTTAATTVTIAR
jgi:hypothetical protein